MMTIREVMEIVDGKVLIGEERLDTRVDTACGSDLMSDVLAFVKEKTVLIVLFFPGERCPARKCWKWRMKSELR